MILPHLHQLERKQPLLRLCFFLTTQPLRWLQNTSRKFTPSLEGPWVSSLSIPSDVVKWLTAPTDLSASTNSSAPLPGYRYGETPSPFNTFCHQCQVHPGQSRNCGFVLKKTKYNVLFLCFYYLRKRMIRSPLSLHGPQMFGNFIISSQDKDVPKRFLIFLQAETRRPTNLVSQETKMLSNLKK